MPQLGETVTEGTVTRWLKREGEEVARDEPLLEVSTDKVETEIPSADAGLLTRIVVAEGETVPIGAVLAVIGHDDGATGPGTADRDADDHGERDRLASAGEPAPRAFRVAMEGGQGSVHSPVAHRDGPRPARHRADPRANGASGVNPPVDVGEVRERVPFSAIRRRTAQNLTRSLHTAAHTLTVVSVDYSAVDRARDDARVVWRQRHSFGLSYLPFIARAVCHGLAAFPRMNAVVDGDDLVVATHVNLGIAVDLDFEGLIVPVVRQADRLRLEPLAVAIADLGVRAREHHLSGDDVARGTFTLTNAGAHGTNLTSPIIASPQVAILSTDGVSMQPAAVRGDDGDWGIAVRPRGNLSLAFDHRANDGAYASAFLDHVRHVIEGRDWHLELDPSPPPGAWS